MNFVLQAKPYQPGQLYRKGARKKIEKASQTKPDQERPASPPSGLSATRALTRAMQGWVRQKRPKGGVGGVGEWWVCELCVRPKGSCVMDSKELHGYYGILYGSIE